MSRQSKIDYALEQYRLGRYTKIGTVEALRFIGLSTAEALALVS